jgi:hypothetical protein
MFSDKTPDKQEQNSDPLEDMLHETRYCAISNTHYHGIHYFDPFSDKMLPPRTTPCRR